jgi:hypothetical protein
LDNRTEGDPPENLPESLFWHLDRVDVKRAMIYKPVIILYSADAQGETGSDVTYQLLCCGQLLDFIAYRYSLMKLLWEAYGRWKDISTWEFVSNRLYPNV